MTGDLPVEDIVLSRMRFAARKVIRGPDLEHMLTVEVHREPARFAADLAEDLIMSVRAQIYAEDLPPERITHTTPVELASEERLEVPLPATWWQHFKLATEGRWWRRWLISWLRPVRYRTAVYSVPWRGRGEVTCVVDLRRFWVYPESRIGTFPGLGSVRVAKHTMNVSWMGSATRPDGP